MTRLVLDGWKEPEVQQIFHPMQVFRRAHSGLGTLAGFARVNRKQWAVCVAVIGRYSLICDSNKECRKGTCEQGAAQNTKEREYVCDIMLIL